MPNFKNSKDQTNLWPAAGLTLFIFILLIATGLVITFGVIQQLRYIAWERSLQETQNSLAAEKDLVRQSAELRDILDQYNTNPMSVSIEQIQSLTDARLSTITSSLPRNPDPVSEVLQDWSTYNIPASIATKLETQSVQSFQIIEKITTYQDFTLYVIRTSDNQTYDFYSKNKYERNQNLTSNIYTIDNIAFDLE